MVTVWPFNQNFDSDIRTEAQFSALNDCNLQFINRVKYVAMVVRVNSCLLNKTTSLIGPPTSNPIRSYSKSIYLNRV